MRTQIAIACLLLMAASPLVAADYRIDQTAYFTSPEAEAADRAALVAAIDAWPTPASPSPEALLAYMKGAEALYIRSQRHTAYLHLRTSLDIDDPAAKSAYADAGSAIDTLVRKVRDTLRGIGKAGFDQAVVAEPALGKYGYVLDRAIRGLPHELPPAEQKVLDELSDPTSDALWNVYQKTRRSTDYGKIHTAHGDLDANKDSDALAADPDRTVRMTAWRQRQNANAARADIYAGILLGVVRLNDRSAKLQHFASAPDAAYFGRQFDRADVDATAKAVEAQAGALMDYQRVRAAHVGRMAGIEQAHSWDMTLPERNFTAPRFAYDALRTTIPKALAPLGTDYVKHFVALLDPASRRTDLVTAQGSRVDDAFSVAAPGVPAGLFLGTWHDDVKGASVVAHEGGHAIHSQLMNEHGVSPFYNHGPSWMHEGIAILNEMLFDEYLYRHAPDAATKAFYLQTLLDKMSFEIFTSAEEAQLEEAIYDGTVAGTVRTAADLDALTLATTRRFEIWPSIDPELAHAWIGKRLMYQDPLYLVNYLYAALLATKMFDMAMKDPADFQKRYDALMTSGFDAPPPELLRRFFGHALSPSELVDADVKLIRAKTSDLGKLYRGIEASSAERH